MADNSMLSRLRRARAWLTSAEAALEAAAVSVDARTACAALLAEVADEAAHLRARLLSHAPADATINVPRYEPQPHQQRDPALTIAAPAPRRKP